MLTTDKTQISLRVSASFMPMAVYDLAQGDRLG